MAESKWEIGLGSVNLAASALIATFTIFAFTGQNELFTEQGKQSDQLGTLIAETASLNRKVDTVVDRAAQIERKIEISQLSPSVMMAKAGFPVTSDVQLVWLGDEIVAFPRSPEAEQILKDKKYLPLQVDPTIAGYVLDQRAASIVKQVLDGMNVDGTPSPWRP
ncbi:hypothetical protein Sa4125_11050 [Aureimonas sp. SA4125]|uniref:hypothetical protein n=1 Tax=Aureimonas sp. SA4125 TaxID=2826993 RepID=UPI001CC571F3|nr:hypothetical protein [Aureimonas sp. SA4125]BDA83563.1 hypothetical protein Sa4125_11050 [Aureimonas sp. SA4125]